jgi:hypothetical protein
MIAKITKGKSSKGVVNYILDKAKQTELLATEGVRHKSRESIIRSFVCQTELNPRVSKTVGHIALGFSMQDNDKLTNTLMVQIAKEYLEKMGIVNTQFIIAKHNDKEHPHIHIVFNRIDNNGKTISDKNDRFRSEKICKELTATYNLYFTPGKENVKRHRLQEPDKTKYEIYDALKSATEKCRSWQDLHNELKKSGIEISFKHKGNSDEVQGIRFEKNGYTFNGSKIDRQFSFSKIDYQLKLNEKAHAFQAKQDVGNVQNQSSSLGGLFDFQPQGMDFDPEENELLKQHKYKKKKKGIRM